MINREDHDVLTRLRWYWVDLIARENEFGNVWDRYFLRMWLAISIMTIL